MIATKQRGERAERRYPRYLLPTDIRGVKISPESRLRKGHESVVRVGRMPTRPPEGSGRYHGPNIDETFYMLKP